MIRRLDLSRLSERHMAALVLAGGLLLYLPFAGSYGLWDPWETHYAEVARQMLRRGDWISLRWPGSPIDGENFWSKPVLSFWLMALAMKIAGLAGPHAPAGELALSSRAEWAVRTPFVLLAVLGIYAVYLCTARFVGRRAGVIAAAVLATCPLYALVGRQAMTDMAFVGPMTMALALAALALFDDDDRPLPRRSRGRISWPHHGLFYATAALFVASALPQIVVDAVQLNWTVTVAGRALPVPGGIILMIPYAIGFCAFLYLCARTRTRAPFYLYIAAILCGIATLAKGLAGLGIPVIIFVAYLLFTWSWKRLGREQLGYGILVALLACAVVVIPWHHAMLVRHGKPFWDELYGDNHWRRLVVGRHGDRGTLAYFLRELGFAVLPWLAVAPSALCAAVMRPFRDSAHAGQQAMSAHARTQAMSAHARKQAMMWFGAIWFVAGYALVSASVTKFHHYILPALPGLAIAVGCTIDDLLDRRAGRAFAVVALAGLPLLALVTHDLVAAPKSAQRIIWLFTYDYVNDPRGRAWPEPLDFRTALVGFAAVFGLATAALAVKRLQQRAALALGLAAALFTLFLLDGFMRRVTPFWSQKALIASYYRLRRSPDEKLVAWQMYWRGENFYTANEIYEGPAAERTVFLGDRNAENLKSWLGRHRGRRVFFVVERSRWSTLQGLLPEDARPTLKIVDETNTKFCLAQASL